MRPRWRLAEPYRRGRRPRRELQTAIEAAKAKIEANALKIAEMERVRGDNQQKIAAAEETIRSANAARLEKEAAISKLGQDNRALTDERERMSGEMARLPSAAPPPRPS